MAFSDIEASLLGAATKLQNFVVVSAAFSGISLWELVICFPSEAKYIYWPEFKQCVTKKRLPSLPSFLLFNARLLTVPTAAILLSLVAPTKLSNDQKVVYFKAFLSLIVLGATNAMAIFTIRTLAIRSSRLPMRIFLWSAATLIIAYFCVCVAVAYYDADLFSIFPNDTEDGSKQPIFALWLNWATLHALLVIFSLATFILCLSTHFKGLRWIPSASWVGKQFYFDTIWFFFLTLSITLIDGIWIYTHRDERVYVALIVPVQFFVTSTLAPRVVRNLKLTAAKESRRSNHTRSTSSQVLERSRVSQTVSSLPSSTASPYLKTSDGRGGDLPYHTLSARLESSPRGTLQSLDENESKSLADERPLTVSMA